MPWIHQLSHYVFLILELYYEFMVSKSLDFTPICIHSLIPWSISKIWWKQFRKNVSIYSKTLFPVIISIFSYHLRFLRKINGYLWNFLFSYQIHSPSEDIPSTFMYENLYLLNVNLQLYRRSLLKMLKISKIFWHNQYICDEMVSK